MKHLERSEENVPKSMYMQVNASSAPVGDVVLFILLLSSVARGVRQGAAGPEHHWELQGNPLLCMQDTVCWWSQLNFEIWTSCLKLKLESKPPGRKQCNLLFVCLWCVFGFCFVCWFGLVFVFVFKPCKLSTVCSQLHIKSSR